MDEKFAVYFSKDELEALQFTLIHKLSFTNEEKQLEFYHKELRLQSAWNAFELINESIRENQ